MPRAAVDNRERVARRRRQRRALARSRRDTTPAAGGPLTSWPALLVLTFVGVYVCAWLGYTFAAYPAKIAVIWPASGFLLGTLVLLERRSWPAALLGAVLANALADFQHGGPPLVALMGGVANVIESLVAALLLVWLLGPRFTLRSLRQVGVLVVGAVLVSNAITAHLGALLLHFGWGLRSYWRGYFLWWAGDGMGMLTVTPAIVVWASAWRERGRERIPVRTLVEAAVVLLATAAVAQVVLTREPTHGGALGSYPYLIFPLLIWSGIRFGPRGAATATLLLAAITSWDAARAPGLFSGEGATVIDQVVQIYVYLGLAALSSLVPAAILREREDAEDRLRESEGRFRQMAETIKEAFFVSDIADGSALYVSPTWSEIWGRPLEEARGPKAWFEAVHPDDRAAVAAGQAAVAAGRPSTTTFRVLRPDGSTRWVRGRAFPVRDGAGRVYRVAGLFDDITELRHAEERLLQSQKMEAVGQLAGGVAHDFNNLLTVIINAAELALDDLPGDSPVREEINAIHSAGESAATLTRQLLTFSRRQVLQPRILRLNEIIAQTSGMLERLIGENIRLTTSLDPDAGAVSGDPGSLEQVLVNLAVNARDAMPAGGELRIELRNVDIGGTADSRAVPPPGGYVLLVVRDTGVGMDDATRARAFEPFFTTKAHGKGTGLGLATVYGIVRQSGGHIAIDAEPGRGSAFRIYLPRVRAPAAAGEAAPAAAGARGGSECVLIAEDEPGVRMVMRQVLARSGYRVLEAGNGETALALVAAYPGPIHLLVTDLVMPGMNGRQLADRFRSLRPEARILFVSGYSDDADLHADVEAAEVEYLGKPFSTDELTRTVRRILDDEEPEGTATTA